MSGTSYESGVSSRQSYHSTSSSSVGSLDRLEESGYSSQINVAELFQAGVPVRLEFFCNYGHITSFCRCNVWKKMTSWSCCILKQVLNWICELWKNVEKQWNVKPNLFIIFLPVSKLLIMQWNFAKSKAKSQVTVTQKKCLF